MELPKFLLGDNMDNENDIFVIHCHYPRFIINLATEQVEWFDDVEQEDPAEFNSIAESLFVDAGEFYDDQIARMEQEE